MKLFGFDVNGVNLSKVKYAIGCIIFFTFMYYTCNDKEFAGFLNSEARIYTNEDKIKYAIFKKYKNDKNDYITLVEFLNIPIKLMNREYYYSKNYDLNKQIINRIIFYSYDSNNNGKLDLKTFLDLPIKTDLITTIKTDKIEFPYQSKIQMGRAVVTFFDRLYYSVVTQTTLGTGDIFPASRKVRILSMLQAMSTIFILLVD